MQKIKQQVKYNLLAEHAQNIAKALAVKQQCNNYSQKTTVLFSAAGVFSTIQV
jgi:peroxiredoxin